MPQATPYIVHQMIGDLPIWTVTVETEDSKKHITQSRDYVDVCAVIGHAVVDHAQHITVLDGNETFLDVELEVKDVEATNGTRG